MRNAWLEKREDQFNVYYIASKTWINLYDEDWKLFKSTSTIQEARAELVFLTDTPYYMICKIVHKGKVIRESTRSEFYCAPDDVKINFIETGQN